MTNSRCRGAVSPKIIAAIVILVLGIGLIMFYFLGGSDGPVRPIAQAYYIDLSSGERFSADASLAPAPITLPDRGEVVQAMTFGCGDCNSPFVGYVEKASDEFKANAKALINQAQGDAPPAMREEAQKKIDEGTLVAAWPEDAGANPSLTWVTKASGEGQDIVEAVNDKCGNTARVCSPESRKP